MHRASILLAPLAALFCALGCRATAPSMPIPQTACSPTFTADWFVGRISWPDLLAPYVGKPNVRYLEIGVFEGRSLLWMLDNILTGPGSRAVAVDLFEPAYEKTFLRNLSCAGHARRVRIAKGRSDVILHTLPLASFDIIFIDGSHAARDVMTDAAQAWLLLAPGGLLIFDDYANDRPREEFKVLPRVPDELKPRVAIDAFVTAFRPELEVVQRDFQLTVRKRVPPCRDWICGGGKHWFYDWAHRRLFDRATRHEIPLSKDQRSHLESMLTALPLGATEPEPSEQCLADPVCKSVVDLLTAP